MHAAPSVTYPVGRSRFAGGLLAALWLLALAVTLAWTLLSAAPGWRQGLGFGAVAACGLAAAALWLRSPTGVLAWEGGAWQWRQGAAAEAGRPEPALDFQARMLLRWLPAPGGPRWRTRWMWVERRAGAADWDALRRAVYSRASHAAPHGDPPPVAER